MKGKYSVVRIVLERDIHKKVRKRISLSTAMDHLPLGVNVPASKKHFQNSGVN